VPNLRQTHFSAGELSPDYYGRTDLEKFGAGMRTLRNFFPSLHGAAVSRPGTEYLGRTKLSSTFGLVKLVPFVYSDTVALVLEMGAGYIRFWLDGALVQGDMDALSFTSTAVAGVDFPLAPGTIITGATSGATATLALDTRALNADGTLDETGSYLTIFNVVGVFVDAEDITFSGGVLYIGTITAPPGTTATTYEVFTTYAEADLAGLQYVQSGDVLTFTHPSRPAQDLRRVANDDWELSEVSFEHIQPYFKDVEAPYTATLSPYYVGKWKATTAYVLGDFVSNGALLYECTASGTSAGAGGPTGVGTSIADNTVTWRYGSDASHPPREWTWKVTVVAQDTDTGRRFETLPATVETTMGKGDVGVSLGTVLVPSKMVVYSDKPQRLLRPTTAALIFEPTGWDSFKTLGFNYYRGRGELFGFIGTTKTREFIDVGDTPNYDIQPPLGQHPFKVYAYDGSLSRTEYPRSLAYFQERRIFGGTAERPAYIFASAVGDYYNFDQRILTPPGSALVFDLLTRRREDIRSLLPLDRLLIFTSSTIWSLAGHQGAPLDSDSVDAKVVEEIGAKVLPLVTVEGCALYARTKGRGVRALVPSDTLSGYKGVDLALLAQHLFRTEEVVDWCYAEDPWGLVWAVRSDGVLLSLSFSRTNETWGWARHDTGADVTDPVDDYRNVCAIPEGNEDAVYVVVERANGVFVERMHSRMLTGTTADVSPLDSSLRVSVAPGPLWYLAYTRIAGSGIFNVADTVTGATSGATGVIAADAAGVLSLSPVVGAFVVGEVVTGGGGGAGTVVSLAETVVASGFAHLQGLSVYAVAHTTVDGEHVATASGPYDVSQDPATLGEVTLPPSFGSAAAVDVGLRFYADAETLDLVSDSLRLKQRTVTSVGFETASATGLQAGPDLDTLAPAMLEGNLVKATPSGGYDNASRAALRQTLPLHTTVVGITREVDVGG
jgi:hypothetical protein